VNDLVNWPGQGGISAFFCEDRNDKAEVAVTQQSGIDDNILKCWQMLLATASFLSASF
jgi:hypothetical protein